MRPPRIPHQPQPRRQQHRGLEDDVGSHLRPLGSAFLLELETRERLG